MSPNVFNVATTTGALVTISIIIEKKKIPKKAKIALTKCAEPFYKPLPIVAVHTTLLPAIVFRNIKYSKFDISRRCHLCVMFELLISCLGDIMDARLLKDNASLMIFLNS